MNKSITIFSKLLLLMIANFLFYGLVVYIFHLLLENFSTVNPLLTTKIGLISESLLLSFIGVLFAFLSKRLILSIALTLIFYSVFLLTNLEKIKYLYTPLIPTDFLYIHQLFLVEGFLKQYILITIITIGLLTILVYLFLKYETKSKLLQKFAYVHVILIILLISLVLINKKSFYDYLKYQHKVDLGRSHGVVSAQRYGFLFVFIKNMIYMEGVNEPENYSLKNIKEIERSIVEKSKTTESNDHVNVIIYLIESFSDPNHAGIKTTQDPIPYFHKLQNEFESGTVLSPVIGGNSANTEFELLTGFSMQFFPMSSIPFIDIPYRNIPSLARELSTQGYSSTVIQPVDLGFFNYKQIYYMLGFDKIIALWNKNNIEKGPAGRYPSDMSIINEIINISNTQDKYFVFAFPNSTHAPWNYSYYDASPIDVVLDEPLKFKSGKKQLKTYINALKTADLAIEKMITYFEKKNEKVAILILGDHQPGLAEYREQYMFNNYPIETTFQNRRAMKRAFGDIMKSSLIENYEAFHSVPYVLWTNFPTQKGVKLQKGINSLILKIFDIINVKPKSKYYSFLKSYSKNNSFMSLLKYTNDKSSTLTKDELLWNRNFENIQYDLIFGEEYFKEKQ